MRLFLTLLMVSTALCNAYGQTYVSGNISGNTTWTKINSPYILNGNVGVPQSVTLTIEPGVTIQRNADHQILINGGIIINGKSTDSIVFVSGTTLKNEHSYFIEFQKSDLNNSNFRFVTFRNQSGNANILRLGNEREGSQTNPKNSGKLLISKSSLNYSLIATRGYLTGATLDIDSCSIVGSNINGNYANSEAVNITNSNLYNSTLTVEPYNQGFKVVNSYMKNCIILTGYSKISVINSKVEESAFKDVNDHGEVYLSGSLLLNSTQDTKHGKNKIENSQIVFTKGISNTQYIINSASIDMINSSILNYSLYPYNGININYDSGYTGLNAQKISGSLFYNIYDIFNVPNFSSVVITNNNFMNTGRYVIVNKSNKDFSVINNYVELKSGKTIDDFIFDSKDDLKYGIVSYTNSAAARSNDIAFKPTNVFKSAKANGIMVSWNKNKETNIKGYHIYWGFISLHNYKNSAFVGPADSTFLIGNAAITDSIAITAVNVNASGINDIYKGFESWYTSANRTPATLTSFSPVIAASGDKITLVGTDFAEVTSVRFGGVNAKSFSILSPTLIEAIVGVGGTGQVSVIAPSNIANLSGFTFIPAPQISSFTPVNGGKNTVITIIGSNFNGATAVSFGGIPAMSYTIVSSTQITAVIGDAISGQVAITTSGGIASVNGFNFFKHPVITSFAPIIAKPGEFVTITGTDFTGTSTVNFGGVQASSFTVISDNSIKAVVGSGASGQISLSTPGGTAVTNGFTYVASPLISSFLPEIAVAGDLVSIKGINFTGATSVSFGGIPATSFTVVSSNLITAVVANGANGDILVVTPLGIVTISGFGFTLPVNNFSIITNTATCYGTQNGSVQIVASKNLNYTATLTGVNKNVANKFVRTTSFDNLGAGTYNLCLSLEGNTSYKQCYTIIVGQPKNLNVTMFVNKEANTVSLMMDGSNLYVVNLNETTFRTQEETIVLPLVGGLNKLSVSTELPCQGKFEKMIDIGTSMTGYPNPFVSEFTLILGEDKVSEAVVSIYTSDGSKVYEREFHNVIGLLPLNLSNLAKGQYLLKLKIGHAIKTLKLIKNEK